MGRILFVSARCRRAASVRSHRAQLEALEGRTLLAAGPLPDSVPFGAGTAEVAGRTPDASASPSSSQDLSVAVSATPPTVALGDQAAYTFIVTNSSSDENTNVVLSGVIPHDFELIAANLSQGSYLVASPPLNAPPGQGEPTLAASLGTLAPGASAMVTVVGKAVATGTITLEFVPRSDQDWNLALAGAAASVAVADPSPLDLSVTASATPNPVAVGQDVTYTFTVINTGRTSDTNVNLQGGLPDNIQFVSADVSQGTWGFEPLPVGGANPPVRPWPGADFGTLAPGASATLRIVGKATAAGTATVDFVPRSDQDPNLALLGASLSVTVADLLVSATATSNPVQVGDQVAVTFTVTNTSAQTDSNVTLHGALPLDVQLVGTRVSQGAVALGPNPLNLPPDDRVQYVAAEFGTLAPGASATLTIVAKGVGTGTVSLNFIPTSDRDPNPAAQGTPVLIQINPVVSAEGVSPGDGAPTAVTGPTVAVPPANQAQTTASGVGRETKNACSSLNGLIADRIAAVSRRAERLLAWVEQLRQRENVAVSRRHSLGTAFLHRSASTRPPLVHRPAQRGGPRHPYEAAE